MPPPTLRDLYALSLFAEPEKITRFEHIVSFPYGDAEKADEQVSRPSSYVVLSLSPHPLTYTSLLLGLRSSWHSGLPKKEASRLDSWCTSSEQRGR